MLPVPKAPLFVPVTLLLKPTAVELPLSALMRDWFPIATPFADVAATKAAFPAPDALLPPMAMELTPAALAFVPIATVLLTGVVAVPILRPALLPMATLLSPVTIWPAAAPVATLPLPVTIWPAKMPAAVLLLPLTLLPLLAPSAVFWRLPAAAPTPAAVPIAVE